MPDEKRIPDDFLEVLFLMRRRIFSHVIIPLPINQFSIMLILYDEESMTFSEIGKSLSIIKQQLSPLINRLEENALVKRVQDTNDKRRVRIKITSEGKKFIDKNQDEIKNRLKNTLHTLSKEEIQEFGASLQTLMRLFSKI